METVSPGAVRLLDALVVMGVAGAKELGLRLGVSATVVRKHLGVLRRAGLVEVAHCRGGKVGPRERVWRATARGQTLVRPGGLSALFRAFLHAARAAFGTAGLMGLLEETGRRIAAERCRGVPDFDAQVVALQQLLNELAVATSLEVEKGAYSLRLLSTFFPEEFTRFPEAFIFYRAMAEEILGQGVELELIPDQREGLCVLRFGRKASRAEADA